MKIEFFSRLEHNYTSAPIAQLAARLTFFIWFWPDQTWLERVRVQFPLEEHDFFSSFKLFFLSIFCMHLYHILINWSQKFWVVYFQYRFIYEQCVINDYVKTIFGHFSAKYIYVFHKNEDLTVILRCLVCLILNWIKSYYYKIFFSCLKMHYFRGSLRVLTPQNKISSHIFKIAYTKT
jgi:hypothetical protein